MESRSAKPLRAEGGEVTGTVDRIERVSYGRISDVEPQQWNRLVPTGQGSARWEFLRSIERAGLPDCERRYVIFRDASGVVVGVAIINVITAMLSNVAPRALRSLLGRLGRLNRLRIAVCGNFISEGMSGIFYRDRRYAEPIARAIDDELRRLKHDVPFDGVLVRELDALQAAELKVLAEQRGFAQVQSQPYYSLSHRWASLDGYRDCLRKKYRQSFERSRRKLQANLEVVRTRDPDDLDFARIYDLYRQVHDDADFILERVNQAFFESVLAEGTGAHYLLLKRQGTVVAFILYLDDGDAFQALYLGYEKRANADLDLYFNLFFSILEESLRRNKRRVLFGQTADQFKIRLGCSRAERHFFVRFESRLLHRVFARLLPSFVRPLDTTEMEVFRPDPTRGGDEAVRGDGPRGPSAPPHTAASREEG